MPLLDSDRREMTDRDEERDAAKAGFELLSHITHELYIRKPKTTPDTALMKAR